MATRLNTVEYCVASSTSPLAPTNDSGGGTTTEGTVTVEIPENTSRTFLSVFIITSCRDVSAATTSRSSVASHTVGVGIDAVADSDTTITVTNTDSGDQASYCWVEDVTSYFVTNYTGTSHTVGLRFSYTDNNQTNRCSLSNLSQKLVLTYQYDDASQDTRVKTVRIPIQSYSTTLPTSETEWGTNQIPDLSSLLPEASISYKDIFFELTWQGANYSSTTDVVLSLRTASDTTHNPATLEMANAGDPFQIYIWKRTDLATNAAQAFKMWADQAGFGGSSVSVVLTVTYTYSWDSSTSLIHSLIIPFAGDDPSRNCLSYYTSSTTYNRFILEFWIPEESPSLKQSGVLYNWSTMNTPAATSSRSGAQSFRSWGDSNSIVTVRCKQHIQRVDSGGPDGAGLSIARGINTCVVDWYDGTATSQYRRGTVLYLNYTATKVSAHSRTIIYCVADDTATLATTRAFSSWSIAIPETSYWIHGVAWLILTTGGSNTYDGMLAFGRGSEGRAQGASCIELGRTYASLESAELTATAYWVGCTHLFNRTPVATDKEALDIETARTVIVHFSAGSRAWMPLAYLSYHGVTANITGDITGRGTSEAALKAHYAGDSSYLIRPGELLGTATASTGSTSYTITWYDTTQNVAVRAREDATHLGVSENGTATSS